MAEAAEVLIAPEGTQPPEIPRAILVTELPQEAMVRRRSDRFIQTAGSLALQNHVQVEYDRREVLPETEMTSLMDAIHRAGWGDKEARQFIFNNVLTDMFERAIKAGLIMKAKLSIDQDGSTNQHGQTMQTTNYNALRFASANKAIRGRSEAETRNNFRLESLRRQGLLKDNYFVVISRCADDIPFEDLADNGFFGETISCSIQATTDESGQSITESAFVAGVAKPGEEPHDEQTVINFGNALSLDFAGKSATEIIDLPFLVPKTMMPNGVIDLVQLYDICAGGTFFGESKPAQDYLDFVKFCQQREAEFKPMAEKITHQLISEAANILTPLAAIKRLHKLSEEQMVRRSIKDDTINPRVFGSEAASYIEQARIHVALGNTELADAALDKAIETAKSYSCPGALEQEKLDKAKEGENKVENNEEADSKIGTIRCIKCRKYVAKEKVVKKEHWECPKCNHKVEICSGDVVREGSVSESEKVVTIASMVDKVMAKNRQTALAEKAA